MRSTVLGIVGAVVLLGLIGAASRKISDPYANWQPHETSASTLHKMGLTPDGEILRHQQEGDCAIWGKVVPCPVFQPTE